jgi:hypothetical protein
MRFLIESGFLYENMKLIYRKSEYSFDVIHRPTGGICSVMINDIQLEIDTEGRVLYLWGLSPYTSWKSSTAIPPKGKKGILRVEFDKDINPGVSVRIGKPGEWPVFHNVELGWICIGDHKNANLEKTVEFCIDCRAVINDNNIIALWLNPKWC